jgi:hypothetical protein
VNWPTGERVARFREFVEMVDLLLRQEVTTYHGQFYRCKDAFYAVTADRSHRFDDLCVAASRGSRLDPAFPGLLSAADSLAVGGALPGHGGTLQRDRHRRVRPVLAADLGAAPREEAVFEEVTATVMPRLRAAAMTP